MSGVDYTLLEERPSTNLPCRPWPLVTALFFTSVCGWAGARRFLFPSLLNYNEPPPPPWPPDQSGGDLWRVAPVLSESLSERGASGARPFTPQADLWSVVARPGPPGLLQTFPGKVMPFCLFAYPLDQEQEYVELGLGASEEEAWLYGARLVASSRLACVTGQPDNVLKGRLLCYKNKYEVHRKIRLADLHFNYPGQAWCEVWRSVVEVVTRQGAVVKAVFYHMAQVQGSCVNLSAISGSSSPSSHNSVLHTAGSSPHSHNSVLHTAAAPSADIKHKDNHKSDKSIANDTACCVSRFDSTQPVVDIDWPIGAFELVSSYSERTLLSRRVLVRPREFCR
eukprot:g17302.t1